MTYVIWQNGLSHNTTQNK